MPQLPLYLIALNLSVINLTLSEIRYELQYTNQLKNLKIKK
jgi:hypothetical protein